MRKATTTWITQVGRRVLKVEGGNHPWFRKRQPRWLRANIEIGNRPALAKRGKRYYGRHVPKQRAHPALFDILWARRFAADHGPKNGRKPRRRH